MIFSPVLLCTWVQLSSCCVAAIMEELCKDAPNQTMLVCRRFIGREMLISVDNQGSLSL